MHYSHFSCAFRVRMHTSLAPGGDKGHAEPRRRGKRPKLSMFCGLSWKHMISTWSKLSDKLKHGMNNNRPSGFWVIDHSVRNIVLINNSRTTWHNRHNAIYGFLNLLQDAYIFSQEKKCWQFWDNAKNMFEFGWDAISSLISTLGGT